MLQGTLQQQQQGGKNCIVSGIVWVWTGGLSNATAALLWLLWLLRLLRLLRLLQALK